MSKDYYQILGLTPDATDKEISKAFRELALKHHPDKNPDNLDESSQKFKEISEAYEVLSDPQKKAVYDRFGSSDPNLDVDGVVGDVFSHFFGHKKRGRDIQTNVQISLFEVIKGVVKKISIPRREKCTTCKGTGAAERSICPSCQGHGRKSIQQAPFLFYAACNQCRGSGRIIDKECTDCSGGFREATQEEIEITIPPGVENGMTMRVSGKGEPIDGIPGDLYVFISVEEHDFFKRRGADLYISVPVRYNQLVLGSEIEVPTLEAKASLKMPSGTQAGSKFRMREMGLPHFDFPGTFGDLVVVVELETPKQINDEHVDILEKLTAIEKNADLPKTQKFNEFLENYNG